jgi:hypothetical protein
MIRGPVQSSTSSYRSVACPPVCYYYEDVNSYKPHAHKRRVEFYKERKVQARQDLTLKAYLTAYVRELPARTACMLA